MKKKLKEPEWPEDPVVPEWLAEARRLWWEEADRQGITKFVDLPVMKKIRSRVGER